MSNLVVIRLPLAPGQKVAWLHWSQGEQVVLASGELAGAEELNQLAGLDGRLLVLVPGQSVFTGAVKKTGSGRQFLKAVPYMLEDALADDVDNLHFTLRAEGEEVSVIAVSHQLMAQWLDWLDDAGLTPWKMLPDFLALPWQPPSWSAMTLDDELLLRTDERRGLTVVAELSEAIVAPLAGDDVQPVEAYGDVRLPVNCTVTQLAGDTPLSVLAKGALNSSTDLLHGPYQRQQGGEQPLRRWWPVAAAAAALLVVGLAGKVTQLYRLHQQQQVLVSQIRSDYQRLFPGERLVSAGALRAQLRGKLRRLGHGSGTDAQLLSMLNDLAAGFAKVGKLHPQSLRFDANQGELRVLATAPDYGSFEAIKQALAAQYQVETGGQSSVDDGVSGTLTLRSKS